MPQTLKIPLDALTVDLDQLEPETAPSTADPSKGHDFKLLGVNIHVPAERAPRLDTNIVGNEAGSGISPENVLETVQGARLGMQAGGAAARVAGRVAGPGVKAVVAAASPLVKYELTRSALEHLGVPWYLADAAAGAVAYRGLKGHGPTPAEPTAPVPAPRPPPQGMAGKNLDQALQEAIASGRLRAKPTTPASAPPAAPVETPLAGAATPSPATPGTAAPQSTAGSAPSPHPSRTVGQMSPQWIQNDLAIQARRAGVKLSADQYQQAEGLVRGGQSIDEAVQAVVPRTGATPPAVPKAKLVASEVPAYLQLIRSGKTPQQAYEAIQAQRDLMEAYGLSTPTAAQTRFPKGMRGKSVIP